MESGSLKLAVQQHRAGNLRQAAGLYRGILQREPQHCDALYMLGVLERQTGRVDRALELVAQAVKLSSDDPFYFFNLAGALALRGHLDEAIQHYRRAAALDPTMAEAHFALATLFERQQRWREALDCYESGLRYRQGDSRARSRAAALHMRLGQTQQAWESWNAAARHLQSSPIPQLGMALALERQGNWSEASVCYERAMAVAPLDEDARRVRALLSLQSGDFEHGWRELEWQERRALGLGMHSYKQWQGCSVAHKKVHIRAVGNLANQLMFFSCLTEFIEQAGSVSLSCDRRLAGYVGRSFPQIHYIPKATEAEAVAIEAADIVMPLVSLPRHLRTTLSQFPSTPSAYLQPCSSHLAHWQQRLQQLGPGLKVGICFNGDGARPMAGSQFPSLTDWESVLQIPGIHAVSLQRGIGGGQFNQMCRQQGLHVEQWESALFSRSGQGMGLESYAALIAALDLVITVPSTAAHLAAAQGTKVWTLLGTRPSWRWMLRGNRMPWYGSMRLYRAQADGNMSTDWTGLFAQVQRHLCSWLFQRTGEWPKLPTPKASCGAGPVLQPHSGARHSRATVAAVDA